MASEERFLPIKVVLAREGDVVRSSTGGSARKVFGEVTDDVRGQLAGQIDSVSAYFEESFRRQPDLPAVGRVTLKEDALAKSHRPSDLFSIRKSRAKKRDLSDESLHHERVLWLA